MSRILCLKLIPIYLSKHYPLPLSYNKFLLQPNGLFVVPKHVFHAFAAYTLSPPFAYNVFFSSLPAPMLQFFKAQLRPSL